MRVISSCGRDLVCHAEIRWMEQVQDLDDPSVVEVTGLGIVDGEQPLSGLHVVFEFGHKDLLSLTFGYCYLAPQG